MAFLIHQYIILPSNFYVVSIENAGGCHYTDTVFINVSNPVPTFDTILNPGCNGVYAEFVNTSDSEFGFTWNFSNGDYSTDLKVAEVIDFGSSFNATNSRFIELYK